MQVRSLVLILARATKRKILARHTSPPSRNIPHNDTFLRTLICNLNIIGIGIAKMKRSPTKERTPFVTPIVTSTLRIHFPFWFLFQKYEMGQHWNMLALKAAMAQQTVKIHICACQ